MNNETVESLRSVLGDEINDLFVAFINDSPPVITQLENAILQADINQTRELAHYLKGSGGNIGAQAFSDACKELEYLAADNAIPDPEKHLNKIKSLFEETKNYMQSLV